MLSSSVSMCLYIALLSTVDKTTLPLKFIPGALLWVDTPHWMVLSIVFCVSGANVRYSVVGSLALEYFCTVNPRNSRLAELPISSNVPFYIFTSLVSPAPPHPYFINVTVAYVPANCLSVFLHVNQFCGVDSVRISKYLPFSIINAKLSYMCSIR